MFSLNRICIKQFFNLARHKTKTDKKNITKIRFVQDKKKTDNFSKNTLEMIYLLVSTSWFCLQSRRDSIVLLQQTVPRRKTLAFNMAW